MKYLSCLSRVALGILAGAVAAQGFSQVDPKLYEGLVWRNIGPFRGGRVAAVSGAIGQPGTYYMGMPLGGVWKTTSAGTTWYPIMDSIKEASSVGAIEVAPSDPNVIYVGMGDLITGGGINEGNGVYKSIDAGKTWQHLGLDETKQIPSILVDPHNPNLVLVAAQGNIRKESDDRGVFRSTDGGATWTKTLFVDQQTGIQKITWAPDHPETMLATTVRHYNAPGALRTGPNAPGGGQNGQTNSGTRLYISHDEGVTWKQITGHGLPALSGRTSVAIAQGTNAQRMFLVGNFGLYRSDDAGANWKQMDPSDRRVANGQGGYNCGVYVNPKNPDIVYVVNTCSYRSLDGGKTFTGFKGAPGGDDPQQFWFDPTDGNRIFLGSDQGATISLDGGLNWSSWYNQPTAQVYHISVDNQFPYWVYATQQDSGCVGTASRGNLGAITPLDWIPHPGYEFGSIVADPLNPKITYAGGSTSGIVKTIYPNGQSVNVAPNIESGLALRRVGNQPLAFSPVNPRELLAGYQFLMSTTDGGVHWKKLSPDLGYPKGEEPKPGQPQNQARPGGAAGQKSNDDDMDDEDDDDDPDSYFDRQLPTNAGGSIESFSVSSLNGNLIWVGTSNGLIKLTKDHGKTWEDVTIPNLPNPRRADISAIDASHHDQGTAYVAIDYHSTGDLTPWFYRTKDFGKTWTKIVAGLRTDQPSGSFARVIRADTKRAGLLFAGTESSMYVSFDDGDNWQSLALNSPNTSYRDMVVKDNDLVVGTYGRSFWILDDISPLRQISATMAPESVVLFKPGDAVRVRRNVNGDTPFPPEVPHAVNAPTGALIYYYLGHDAKGKVSVEISDASGNVVRRMSSDAIVPLNEPAPPIPDFWVEKREPLPVNSGMHRIAWNLRYDNPPAFSHSYEINANPGETPASPEGPLVLPGTYTVKLTVDGKSFTQTVTVKNDPRSPAKANELKAAADMQMRLLANLNEAWDAYQVVAKMREDVGLISQGSDNDDVTTAVENFDSKLSAVGGSAGRGRGFGGGRPGAGAPRPPSFADVHGGALRLLNTLDGGDMAPNEPMAHAFDALIQDFAKVKDAWIAVNGKDLETLNAVLAKHNIKPVKSAIPSVSKK